MIKNIFYTGNMTYIKDMKDVEVTTNSLGFAGSFDLARSLNVEFDYDEINNYDEIGFSHYLQYKVGDCDNRNIHNFFNKCDVLGIQSIIQNEDLFGRKAVRQTISNIIDDYNSDVALYNIECYGTDTYIAKIVYEHLMMALKTNKNTKTYSLFKLVDNDEYNLDEFLKLLEIFNNVEKDTKLIEEVKNKFNKDYDSTSEAIEWYIELLVTYGGDSSHKIFKAMNEVFDDIIEDKPSCDKAGLIERLKDE